MKLKNTFGITLLFFFSLFIWSCNNDNEGEHLQPSISSIAMEGEGGEAEILLNSGEWNVAKVVNKDGGVSIFGKIFSPDGQLIKENTLLNLTGFGKLEALWQDKGFHIIREQSTVLKIIVEENTTENDFSFAAVLQSGEELKEIVVMQKKSQGYRFDKIDYAIKKGDGDSLSVERDPSTYSFYTQAPYESSVFPFFDLKKRSHFESKEKNTFDWVRDEQVLVKIPVAFSGNEVYLGDWTVSYSNFVTEIPTEFKELEKKIDVPAGSTKISFDIEYRTRKISYTLSLINNRTGESKTIEGKWIEKAPTGNYKIAYLEI